MSKVLKVTTVDQARALPEIASQFHEEKRRLLDADEPGVGRRGDTVIDRKIRPFCPGPTDGDQLLFFADADGRVMQVVYTPEGPAKTPFRL